MSTVDDYVASLSAALHGPKRTKARMVAEVRADLTDAIAERTQAGLTHQQAADQVVREFGAVEDLVESWQRELTIAQARHTARAVALTVPFVIACWTLLHHTGGDTLWHLPSTLAAVSAVAAVLAAATLATTGTLARWLPTPDRLPLTVAWAGTAASMSMALATLALAISAVLGTNWPLLTTAGLLTATSHALVAGSARTCRRCARLTAPHRQAT
ncbi:permease prefix domain 1-containing protein [Actinokineospora globicatena]|uniref:Uncharacterized protein n=1 Tax=Actinokineospora globicatena TaxID=103729 RepID=A0A9W6QKD7_9PSEU|nr:permease prefix domain 1-containing protein [Actinokineospora globicatena]GLW91167.1 hypothetical protein Aglo03_19830 [Actinokineospora globicatena]